MPKNIRFEPALNVPQEILDEILNRLEDVFKSIELPKRPQTMNLYAGQVLHVDLSSRTVAAKAINKDWLKDYIGGWGLATRYFYDLSDPKIDALSPDTPIVIMTGPLVRHPGTHGVPALSRFQVAGHRHDSRIKHRGCLRS